ncbi:MAG: hypothetical protein H6573_19040 [Lewinellaceae bacterium]|nr:hypothetical protein [Lewinellaceae bacterium]
MRSLISAWRFAASKGRLYITGHQCSPGTNRLAYWIAVVILLVLTAYLISFYASVVYNAFLLDPWRW